MSPGFSRFLRYIPIIFFMAWHLATLATPAAETVIQKRFRDYLGINVKTEAITPTPYSGLYEIQIDNQLVYTDSEAHYLFIGNILDLPTQKNYTEERLRQLTVTDFSTLPKNLAIKIVKGNGTGIMAIFSDPSCRYCKQLEYNLRNVDDVTIYLYPLNILSEKSIDISRNIWCSSNPAQAWQDWMIRDKKPETAGKDCAFPNDPIRDLGRKLNIQGTPTIFFTDGTRIPGAASAEEINRKLRSLQSE